MIINRGLIIPPITNREEGAEHIFGGLSGVSGEVINPSGDWTAYLPEKEAQNKNGFETQGCTAYGLHNALETLLNFKKVKVNFSDRYLCICADVTPKKGPTRTRPRKP